MRCERGTRITLQAALPKQSMHGRLASAQRHRQQVGRQMQRYSITHAYLGRVGTHNNITTRIPQAGQRKTSKLNGSRCPASLSMELRRTRLMGLQWRRCLLKVDGAFRGACVSCCRVRKWLRRRHLSSAAACWLHGCIALQVGRRAAGDGGQSPASGRRSVVVSGAPCRILLRPACCRLLLLLHGNVSAGRGGCVKLQVGRLAVRRRWHSLSLVVNARPCARRCVSQRPAPHSFLLLLLLETVRSCPPHGFHGGLDRLHLVDFQDKGRRHAAVIAERPAPQRFLKGGLRTGVTLIAGNKINNDWQSQYEYVTWAATGAQQPGYLITA